MTIRPFFRPMLIIAIGTLCTGAVAILYLPAAQDSTTTPEPETTMPKSEPIEDANRNKIFSTSGYDVTPLTKDEIDDLAKDLTPEQFRITQKAGTEPAFCGTLLDNKKEGMYVCVVCGLPLFKSDHKFDSGTGWPSFFQPFDSSHVGEESDVSHGMARTEIRCNRCEAHLGHLFPDGPPPSRQRYCLNGASLDFVESGEAVPPASKPKLETAYFAGGCFWGVEHAFQQIPGVVDATSGYQQGATSNPSYKEVCTKSSGHAESVRVLFDPTTVDFETLVKFFFIVHDPTQLNRQGPDLGSQYRSGIYTTTAAQAEAAKKVLEAEQSSTYKDQTIVTEIEAAKTFWPAESYHQNYISTTGRACHVNIPAALKAIGIDPVKKPTS